MQCPYCGYEDSRVTDSRAADGGIRRRRECLSCGARFTTLERVQLVSTFVVKKDGRREEFSRDKIIAGLRKACEKRPVDFQAIERIAAEVEAAVQALGKAEVPSAAIGELVMERLKEVDQIAYVRFASVYRAFADLEDLRAALDELERPRSRREAPPADQLPLPMDGAPPVTVLRPPAAPRRRGRPRKAGRG
ncbi:MAG TPA: transcriptional regulator NrdR, partial [Dehalococcoidia bacterium]